MAQPPEILIEVEDEEEGAVGLAEAEDLPDQSSSSTIRSLANDIQRGVNTDFKIHINGSHFEVHLIILHSVTRFFDDYETGQEMTIPADKVAAEIFDIIYDWVVDKHPPMPREKLPALLQASEYLQMEGLTWYLKRVMGEGKGDFVQDDDEDEVAEEEAVEDNEEGEVFNIMSNRDLGAGDHV